MNENGKLPTPQTAGKHDPRELLDGIKRAKILALLEMGCSRRMAAKQVACAPSTITRTAQREPEFAKQLADAEGQADVRALRLLTHTAQQERYWRVAAWLLERRNPEEYGRRPPHTFTPEQVMKLLLRGMESVVAVIPDDKLDELVEGFENLLADVVEEGGRLPVIPVPVTVAELPPPTATPQPAAVVSDGRNGSSKCADRNVPPAPRFAPPVNGNVPAAAMQPMAVPRRNSCLEQFVQRSSMPELQPAGT